jgi:hypothetical protein
MGSWESANPSECAFGVRLLALQGCGIIFGADLCLPHPPLSSKPCARFYEIVLHESVGSMEHLDGYIRTAPFQLSGNPLWIARGHERILVACQQQNSMTLKVRCRNRR